MNVWLERACLRVLHFAGGPAHWPQMPGLEHRFQLRPSIQEGVGWPARRDLWKKILLPQSRLTTRGIGAGQF